MMNKKGFTLIELSMVLVIIGLVASAVVGGKSLIESARYQKMGTQLLEISTSVKAFQLKYGALPGDMPDAYDYWPTRCGADTMGNRDSCNGNDDGLVRSNAADGSAIYEYLYFWLHLHLAEFKPSYEYTPHKWSINQGHAKAYSTQPVSVIDNIMYRVSSSLSRQKSYITGVRVGTTWSGSLTPKQAKMIDNKIDDGIPQSGKLVGYGGLDLKNDCLTVSRFAGDYDLSKTLKACRFNFYIVD